MARLEWQVLGVGGEVVGNHDFWGAKSVTVCGARSHVRRRCVREAPGTFDSNRISTPIVLVENFPRICGHIFCWVSRREHFTTTFALAAIFFSLPVTVNSKDIRRFMDPAPVKLRRSKGNRFLS